MKSFATRSTRMENLSSEKTLRAVGTLNGPFKDDHVGKDANETYTVRQRPRCKASIGEQCPLIKV